VQEAKTGPGRTVETPRPEDAERLDSWKEIATHLRRQVRTVQRWEKGEGLPVHRHLHQKLGSVYAYRAELDRWWKERRAELERAPARTRGGQERRVMLAVLPIENWSRDPEQEYLSDGITEEMILHLGRLNPQRLGVIARQSAMVYKGTKKRVDEIGRELGVDYLVGGSAQRADQHVRITAHLIGVRDQTQIWAESYDRALDDLLGLQRDVAVAIAGKIQVALAPHVAPPARPGIDPDAYEAYLRGRFLLSKRTPEALGKAIACFERAAAIDPGYALAYSGLADCYDLIAYYGAEAPSTVFPKAKAAAAKAVELDPALPEAHALLAEVSYLYDWDWSRAEVEYRQAVDLGPNCLTAHLSYGLLLSLLGRHEEALAELRLAERLDPLSLLVGTQIGFALYAARRYGEAVERLEQTLELDDAFPLAHTALGMVFIQQSLHERAMAEFRRAQDLAPGDLTPLALLGYTQAIAGKRNEARKVLQVLKASAKKRYVSPAYPAAVHLALREHSTALDLAEEARRERSGFLTRLKVEPLFDPLRSEPRFAKLLRAVGLG
jgi:TolB-like protein/tetratricopeptide (TPR) repeat protein